MEELLRRKPLLKFAADYKSPTSSRKSEQKRSPRQSSVSTRRLSGTHEEVPFRKRYHKSPISEEKAASDGERRWKVLIDAIYGAASSEEEELCFEEMRARAAGVLK